MCESLLLLRNSLRWLAKSYQRFRFYCERDVVWTIQTNLNQRVARKQLPFTIYNDYPIVRGKRRSLTTDIAIVDKKASIELAVEFKYEPSHEREDILKQKLPVVVWDKQGVGDDVKRVQRFVNENKSKFAVSVFIDEGAFYRKRKPHQGTEWIDWPNGISVLCSMPTLVSIEPA